VDHLWEQIAPQLPGELIAAVLIRHGPSWQLLPRPDPRGLRPGPAHTSVPIDARLSRLGRRISGLRDRLPGRGVRRSRRRAGRGR
jgi:hypothetical protein